MIKTILLSLFTQQVASSEILLPGSQLDDHNCVLDGGYSWCESTQKCSRPWEEPCPILSLTSHVTGFCQNSLMQTCRKVCDIPQCEIGHCAQRIDNCCDYICQPQNIPCNVCPPPIPCPAPPPNCQYTHPESDNCGCITSCGTIDCSNSISLEGEICGGYMPQGMTQNCIHGLECVYTLGPMVADAPGTCQKQCKTTRDTYGNCVSDGCSNWFDGCNSCSVSDNTIQTCRQDNICYGRNPGHCMDNIQEPSLITNIPWNCVSWFDGCNTCYVNNGALGGCTMMMCFTNVEPYCMSYTTGELRPGDICYRFCEDGSQTSISRRDDCPKNTACIQDDPDRLAFDTCSNNALRCVPFNAH